MEDAFLRWDVGCRKDVAFARMKALGFLVSTSSNPDNWPDDNQGLNDVLGTDGLAVPLTSSLSNVYDKWVQSVQQSCKQAQINKCGKTHEENSPLPMTNHFLVHETKETDALRRVLHLHIQLCKLDSTLAEELGREGSHAVLTRLIRFDLESEMSKAGYDYEILEEDQDAVMELQDLACEIGSMCDGTFPMKFAPFPRDELCSRLPLCFSVSSVACDESSSDHNNIDSTDANRIKKLPQHILIHQVTARQGAQDDVGFVMWPSAVALASWVATNSNEIIGKHCLEIGAGCGLTGLTAASIVSDTSNVNSSVILTDFNEKVLRNADRNILLNGLEGVASTAKLDFYTQKGDKITGGWIDGSGTLREPVDVILAADVICKPEDAVASANTIYDALRPGGVAFVVSADAKHRFGVDRFSDECRRVGLDVQISNVADMYDGALLSSSQGLNGGQGIEQTSGYVEGMTLTFFRVIKDSRQGEER